MPVARPVVGEDPLLRGGLDVGERRRDVTGVVPLPVVLGECHRALEHVQRDPGVAAGDRDEVRERLVGERHAARRPELAREAPLGVIDRPSHDPADVVVGERLQAPHAQPRQERGVDLEVRVLRRRADERDGAVLDVRQERVLLRLVEAVDLVDEQHGPLAVEREPLLGIGDSAPNLGHTGHDGRERREVGTDLASEEAGEGRLAGPRRAPEQQRREVAARDRPPGVDRFTNQVPLALELLE